ncbi:hypothetical protein D915_010855 [Fasciola hepatica]|uniref:Cadherin domain protein n=1 Tax=Fasciola hepatica TaxID=6192 RepID=A0A4E0RVF5_FASHE|nr:hypothetical protein D915_010855 [Fasciola hepatica]
MFHAETLLLFLQYCPLVVETLSFTKPVYHVMVCQDEIPSLIPVIRLQVGEMKPTSRIQYLLENQGVEQSAFRIDTKTGALELFSKLPPISMALTVRAILEDGPNHFEAETVVRVHVVCFAGSHAWDAVRK